MKAKLKIWLRAIRVEQWTKNGVVMLAWFFSVADASQREIVRGWESFLMAAAMAVSFSFISSSFYLLNDVSDYDADRLHPRKQNICTMIQKTHTFPVMQTYLRRFLSRTMVSTSPMAMLRTVPMVMGRTPIRVSASKAMGTAQNTTDIKISAMGT